MAVVMRTRKLLAVLCWAAAGLLSLAVTGYGVYSFMSADLRRDTAITFLFCLLPALSFPVFLMPSRWMRRVAALEWAMAAGYLAVYSMLNWRSCAELAICNSALMTMRETLATWPVKASFAVAVLQLGGLLMKRSRD
jgi:hypothetical protein